MNKYRISKSGNAKGLKKGGMRKSGMVLKMWNAESGMRKAKFGGKAEWNAERRTPLRQTH
jgi:hypothetical protein